MAEPRGILPHAAWKEMVRAAGVSQYRRDPRARVADPDCFKEMKAHVLDLYKDIEAVHSFEDPAGTVFDCIWIEQQPALSGHTGPVPQPPDLRPVLDGEPPAPGLPRVADAAAPTTRDRHGNLRQAPPGTIPMRRVTLAELTRFETLRDFQRKEPGPSAGASPLNPTAAPAITPSTPDPDTGLNHRYAYTEQAVDNLGGHSSLAVYQPAVSSDQVFSLAQHWYSAGDGAANQTVEAGWQVYPDKYGHAQPVLFIFWTADDYASTGNYNLDAAAFVQTNARWPLGGALSPVSTQGGQQLEIEVSWFLFAGNWWLYVGGLAASDAVGYYPGSLFNGGAMTTGAEEIKYGGETVCRAVAWGAMGSGAHASAGFGQAAYQRNIYYFPSGGGSQWAGLDVKEPSPGCYTLVPDTAPAPWGIYHYYGGPGGGDC
jgi:hypothetical protein